VMKPQQSNITPPNEVDTWTNFEGLSVHVTPDEPTTRTNAWCGLKFEGRPSIHSTRSQSPMTAALMFHVSLELKPYLVIWKPDSCRDSIAYWERFRIHLTTFHLLGLGQCMAENENRTRNNSLMATPIPPLTAQTIIDFFSPGRHPTHFLPRFLAMYLSTMAQIPVLPSISREKPVKTTPSCSGHAHTADDWPIFHTVNALRHRQEEGKVPGPQELYVRT
jgi:hypothetical protein